MTTSRTPSRLETFLDLHYRTILRFGLALIAILLLISYVDRYLCIRAAEAGVVSAKAALEQLYGADYAANQHRPAKQLLAD